ncbi:ExbD/TolR family protein [Porticoccus litoralis]|uniref:Biopolymer transporter ExbD n=1 Tax=Porticoccus litoralis TaxID=434086 RepID=A0AAW8B866_9GAMM|nr:biopolymer transporter ExbD [Porticoccus litoralis]MDP1521150.1 biopolymer transporter ExbD [Porticoccus litoralis]
MKFRRQRKNDQGVNLTPLIDVVFLLLIFFMVSTTFTKESHLVLDLPEADGKIEETPAQQIEVLIGREGDYSINGKPLINRQIETLMKALDEVSQGNSNTPLTITADANTTHQAVVTAMDAAGRMGFVHLKITTKQPDNDT